MTARKLSERGPEPAAWVAVMVALVHRSSLATDASISANARRTMLAGFGFIADDVIDLLHARIETEARNRRINEAAEDEAMRVEMRKRGGQNA